MDTTSLQIVCLALAQLAPQDIPVQGATPARPSSPLVVEPGSSLFQPTEGQPVVGGPVISPAAGQLQPPTQTGSLVAVDANDPLKLAARLVDQALTADPEQLEGTPLSLLEALQRLGSAESRGRAVAAYWRLCAAVGEFSCAQQQLDFLPQLSVQFAFEEALVEAARSAALARRAKARVGVLGAQTELADAAQLAAGAQPLPADKPLVGAYRTRFATMFANRPAPTELRRIDRELPHQLRLIERRAQAVAASDQAVEEVLRAYRDGHLPLHVVLQQSEQLDQQRQALLAAVVHYNRQIADYSFAVVGATVPAETLVSTLIPSVAAPGRSLIRDQNVLPAGARQEIVSPTAPAAPFREVQPATAANPAAGSPARDGDGETSILRRRPER